MCDKVNRSDLPGSVFLPHLKLVRKTTIQKGMGIAKVNSFYSCPRVKPPLDFNGMQNGRDISSQRLKERRTLTNYASLLFWPVAQDQ